MFEDISMSKPTVLDRVRTQFARIIREVKAENRDLKRKLAAQSVANPPDVSECLRGFVLNRPYIRTDSELQPTLDKLFDLAEAALRKAGEHVSPEVRDGD